MGRGKSSRGGKSSRKDPEVLRLTAPHDRASLQVWLRSFLGLRMPERAVCQGHCSPLDYLEHSFFERRGDRVVWACRGGGKTMLGAAATMLDLLFKPGIQIRILGGSLEQSDRMYGYLRGMFAGRFAGQLAEPPTRRGLILRNGSRVEILAQSDRAVRGQRVQKLRCDEVELFVPEVWEAAQLVTKSIDKTHNSIRTTPNGAEVPTVRGAIEVFSTMHRPGGLMQKIIAESPGAGRKVFAWCIWDVIEPCPHATCGDCVLQGTCGGRAKKADGFVRIEDVIAMRSRVGRALWDREMLCLAPKFSDAVFEKFSRALHVRPWAPCPACEAAIAGVDFGIAGAFVWLWIALTRDCAGRAVAHVVDEAVVRNLALDRSLTLVQQQDGLERLGRRIEVVYCDVAGRQRNSHSGKTDIKLLQEAGFVVRSRAMGIADGLGLIESMLEPAAGLPRLYVDPRCARLIAALEGYRRGKDDLPIKDGVHDHLIDALRYGLVNHLAERAGTTVRGY